jgi:phenylalanyl-tRNA synthetase beta chain
MRVPISWLRDYVDITLPVEALAEKLTIAGLEVKEIDYIGIAGGRDRERLVWDREKLIMGHILEVNAHPDADRLVLATVDYGGSEQEVAVTGAPNLFQFVGQGNIAHLQLYSPFALEGAVLYDGHKEGQAKMTLKGRSLRGIFNRSMLLSEKELGLSDDHEGIIILPGDYTPGTPVQDVLGDAVLEIEIIPNIARAASILGVAREVAALTGQALREPDYGLEQAGTPLEGKVVISTENPELNPRFVAILIEGVEQKPSPGWMQRRLKLAGQRPLNVVVDISNYVMLEIGQPNHTFDYDVLRRRADRYDPDGPVHIVTRLPHEGETLTTLDGEERQLLPFNILVTDPAGNLSLGGIMGGLESEIGDATRNVLLEAAAWNFMNIRRSATALKLNTEAGFRFSRGVHPSQALLGAKRAAELMRRLAGGRVAQGIVDAYPSPPEPVAVCLTAAEVKRLGGIDLSQAEIARYLEALQFTVRAEGNRLWVTSPDHRLDIEGSHDLVEEVLRIYGYDRIPTTEMSDRLPPQRNNEELEREEQIKDSLVELGLQEVITYRLTSPEREGRLLPRTANLAPDDRPYVTLANPITIDRVAMRHSLLASALEVLAANSRFQEQIALFELGHVYLASEEGQDGPDSGLPDELRRLVVVLTGPRQPEHWQGRADAGSFDFFDLKGILEGLFADLRLDGVTFAAARHPSFRPNRTARILLDGKQLGYAGELHPLVVENFEIRSEAPLLAAELDLELILRHVPERFAAEPVPNYPAVREDIAVLVDQSVPAADVAAVIRRSGGPLLKEVTLFDLYEGERIPAGKKSLAYHLTFQSPGKTLTDKEVSKSRQRIVDQLGRQLNGKLRDA